MDTSEQYIKMCEKAKEIQEDWNPQPFDNFCYRNHREDAPWWWSKLDRFGELNEKRSIHIFLPRQDQLQEMVWKAVTFTGKMTGCIEYYWNSRPHTFTINTAEQLWLAFVMKEKYGKVWDGNKWIKIGDKP